VAAFLALGAEFQLIATTFADTDEELRLKAVFSASTV
jgi:hypothetical protein